MSTSTASSPTLVFDVVHVVGIGLRSLVPAGRPWHRPFYVQDYDEAMSDAVQPPGGSTMEFSRY